MGRLLNIAVSAALMLMLTLAGCGGSGSKSPSSSTSASQTASAATSTQTSSVTSSTPTSAQAPKTSAPTAHAPKNILPVTSPVFSTERAIPALYTCDGAGVSPPLQWRTVPQGTAELALFVLDLKSAPTVKPVVDWAVAGLQPTLTGIPAGKLPPGAIVGRNSLGQSRYTICPTKSEGSQRYAVALLTLPHSIAATPGFNATAFFKKALHTAEYSGLGGFTYQRR